MPLKIFLRTQAAISPFRRSLKKLLETPNSDSAILCSGYFQENFRSSPYSIISDGLASSINSGCNAITFIGGKFTPAWRVAYRNFLNNLISGFPRLSITPLIVRRNNWHAKIAIKLSGNVPVAALIGSSNLTAPAYAERYPRWNYESDVLLWVPNAVRDAHFSEDNIDIDYGKFEAILNPEIRQLSEGEQLQRLYNDVTTGTEPFN